MEKRGKNGKGERFVRCRVVPTFIDFFRRNIIECFSQPSLQFSRNLTPKRSCFGSDATHQSKSSTRGYRGSKLNVAFRLFQIIFLRGEEKGLIMQFAVKTVISRNYCSKLELQLISRKFCKILGVSCNFLLLCTVSHLKPIFNVNFNLACSEKVNFMNFCQNVPLIQL